MRSELHDKAQKLAANAELAFRKGTRGDALRLYGEAARLEGEALAGVSADRPRTKALFAVSYIALLYKSGALSDAEQNIYRILADASLQASAKAELREMLEVIWDEQALSLQGMKYAGEEIEVALRGGLIGSGTAPLDLAVHYMEGVTSIFYRVAELEKGIPLRTRGAPSVHIQELVQARATQPAAGSYRFSIRLAQPEQAWLFEDQQELSPSRVAQSVLKILRSALAQGPEPLPELVHDVRYRSAIVKLIRNVLPSASKLREVEIRSMQRSSQEARVVLLPGSRARLNEQIPTESVGTKAVPVKVEGVLRALHLDKRWLELSLDNGTHRKFATKSDEVDDVIGPMVNKRVVVTGMQDPNKPNPLLVDIELKE